MSPSWLWLQAAIVVFVLAGMIIAIVKGGTGVRSESGWVLRPREAVDATLAAAAEVFAAVGVEVDLYAQRGDPADAILDVAEERGADLIIVGNRGRAGAKRFLLGSVPNRISHHAPCAVLIIRTP